MSHSAFNPSNQRNRFLRLGTRILTAAIVAACLFGSGAVGLRMSDLHAQERGAAQRVVQGKVVDKAGAAVKGSVVYLKDDHTLAIKSYIADDEGAFRFGQLSTTTDYEIWAEHNGHKSGVKTVSSFDSKSIFIVTLKIDAGA